MGLTRAAVLTLAIGMLVAGSINTIAYKVADWQLAPGAYDATICFNASTVPGHNDCTFTHPFFQVYAMFLGECCCLAAYFTMRALGKQPPLTKRFNPLIFLPCALCDMCGTSLMLLGLLLTYMSNFQMLRGSVVLFTGGFSRIFLGRILSRTQWLGIAFVLLGTAVVGADALVHPSSSTSASNPFLGNVLIVIAQIIVAIQFVLEEKFVSSLDVPPLLVVGLEGAFGFSALTLVLIGMYHIPGVKGLSETPVRLEDPIDAMQQTFSGNITLTLALICAVLSIAFYNFFGISVTKSLSAAHRMVMDTTRTVIVWIFAMSVHYATPSSGHGQPFSSLQLVGFLILALGTMVYYDVHAPLLAKLGFGPAKRAHVGDVRSDPLLVNSDGAPLPLSDDRTTASLTPSSSSSRGTPSPDAYPAVGVPVLYPAPIDGRQTNSGTR